MIQFVQGNLLESQAEALVNAVNCVGVMGKGIAYQFRHAYPLMYQDYQQRCKAGEVTLGRITAFHERDKVIINLPTKYHWRDRSSLASIQSGLAALVEHLDHESIRSVAIPAVGCGAGGLLWRDVRPLIVSAFDGWDRGCVDVYAPAEDSIYYTGMALRRM